MEYLEYRAQIDLVLEGVELITSLLPENSVKKPIISSTTEGTIYFFCFEKNISPKQAVYGAIRYATVGEESKGDFGIHSKIVRTELFSQLNS